jgi:hypothetical protein
VKSGISARLTSCHLAGKDMPIGQSFERDICPAWNALHEETLETLEIVSLAHRCLLEDQVFVQIVSLHRCLGKIPKSGMKLKSFGDPSDE